jgi:hypothetical protein
MRKTQLALSERERLQGLKPHHLWAIKCQS